jgi:hypothetical protein
MKNRLLSTLILVYSGIDILASLERQPNEGTKAAFVCWAEDYLRKQRPCHARVLSYMALVVVCYIRSLPTLNGRKLYRVYLD